MSGKHKSVSNTACFFFLLFLNLEPVVPTSLSPRGAKTNVDVEGSNPLLVLSEAWMGLAPDTSKLVLEELADES